MSTPDPENLEITRQLVEESQIIIHLLKTGGDCLATAQVIFLDGLIEINGFRVKECKFEGADYWAEPPKYGRKYAISFWINDKALWKDLSEKIIRYYLNAKDKEVDDETIEDIPF